MSTEKLEAVKYTVLEKSLIGNEIHEAGATVDYAGLPAENLAPQCEVGHARYQEYLASNKARVATLNSQYGEVGVGDAAAFAAAFRKELAESQANQSELIAAAVAAAIAKVFPNGTDKKAKSAETPIA